MPGPVRILEPLVFLTIWQPFQQCLLWGGEIQHTQFARIVTRCQIENESVTTLYPLTNLRFSIPALLRAKLRIKDFRIRSQYREQMVGVPKGRDWSDSCSFGRGGLSTVASLEDSISCLIKHLCHCTLLDFSAYRRYSRNIDDTDAQDWDAGFSSLMTCSGRTQAATVSIQLKQRFRGWDRVYVKYRFGIPRISKGMATDQ
jgi:hypothetical protein